MDLKRINTTLKTATPTEVVEWALGQGSRPVVTTNFRPYETVILHAVVSGMPEIPVIWCDTGYNTRATYVHAEKVIQQMKLNVDLFVPLQTTAHRDAVMGIPAADTPEHDLFTEQVKLEPFRRAMHKYQPDVWFTNLRQGQTALRDTMDIVTLGADGILKVSPFYYYSDEAMDVYANEHALEIEHNYFDPTKVLANRECGLHK